MNTNHKAEVERQKCDHKKATFRFRPKLLKNTEVVACLRCGLTQVTVNGEVVHREYHAAPIFVGFTGEIAKVVREFFGDGAPPSPGRPER